ncbi:aminoglycoside phosphotransferase (APT) family kinase protein [Actinoplanes tereljensis]|nr:phosphotransferase [Actinoplanes tereljensis]
MDLEPFAAGREADVFALDGGRVLRRYRTGMDVRREAEVMAYVGGLGYPVPEVYAADGTDLVMERLDGPTLAEAALIGELSIPDGVAILADLLRRLHELPARGSGGGGSGSGSGSGSGDTIVHLDLHPENVLLTRRGPVVIDWCNAGDGVGDLDTALSALILAQVAIGSIEHSLGAAAGTMVDLFLELAPGDPIRLLDEAAAFRRQQLTMSPDELAMIDTAVARVRAAA